MAARSGEEVAGSDSFKLVAAKETKAPEFKTGTSSRVQNSGACIPLHCTADVTSTLIPLAILPRTRFANE